MPTKRPKTVRNKRVTKPAASKFLIELAFRHTLSEDEVLAIQTGKRDVSMKLEIETEKDPKRIKPVMGFTIV